MDKITLSRAEFKALASDTRIDILKLMSKRNYNVSELSKSLSLSGPTIKEHLEKLSDSGLIEPLPGEYKWKYYKLTRKGQRIVEPQEVPVAMILSLSVLAMIAGALLVGFSVQSPLAEGMEKNVSEPSLAAAGAESKEFVLGATDNAVEQEAAQPLPAQEPEIEKEGEILFLGAIIFGVGVIGIGLVLFRSTKNRKK